MKSTVSLLKECFGDVAYVEYDDLTTCVLPNVFFCPYSFPRPLMEIYYRAKGRTKITPTIIQGVGINKEQSAINLAKKLSFRNRYLELYKLQLKDGQGFIPLLGQSFRTVHNSDPIHSHDNYDLVDFVPLELDDSGCFHLADFEDRHMHLYVPQTESSLA